MAPSTSKSAAPAKDKDRRKSSNGRETKVITLKIASDRLRAIVSPPTDAVAKKEDTPMQDAKDSPAAASTPTQAPAASAPENGSDSNPATPANGGTPGPAAMGPPEKKKGVKRTAGAAAAANGEPKARGKPGPKKRQRLEDGTLEPARANAHRLGPKANQGAINAGLRALDRSGKPCRKWNRGGFKIKTFTGVEWEVRRWTAPPKPKPVEATSDEVPGSAAVSTTGSSKENHKEGVDPLAKSENSNSGGDIEMQSLPSVQASSPAPMPIAAGA